jgi:U1 small nuclear ribonucleoprotein
LHFCTAAYKHGDGKKIDGRRVLVDVERGRTVKGWLPRRLGMFFHISYVLLLFINLSSIELLGGGLGGTRKGAPDENVKHSGRDDRSDERFVIFANRSLFRY